jgi:hypothetical protein
MGKVALNLFSLERPAYFVPSSVLLLALSSFNRAYPMRRGIVILVKR